MRGCWVRIFQLKGHWNGKSHRHHFTSLLTRLKARKLPYCSHYCRVTVSPKTFRNGDIVYKPIGSNRETNKNLS